MASCVVLQYFIILLAVKCLQVSSVRDRSLGVLSQLFSEDTKNPLIVVVQNANELRAFEDEQGDELNSVAATEAKEYINDAIVKENYESVLYNVLRSDGGFEGNEEEQEAHKKLIANALRQRCQAKNDCERKCSYKKPKKSCQKDCKAVYDYLVKCPPPGNEWKKNKKNKGCGCDSCNISKENSCKPKRGKTCPPSWKR